MATPSGCGSRERNPSIQDCTNVRVTSSPVLPVSRVPGLNKRCYGILITFRHYRNSSHSLVSLFYRYFYRDISNTLHPDLSPSLFNVISFHRRNITCRRSRASRIWKDIRGPYSLPHWRDWVLRRLSPVQVGFTIAHSQDLRLGSRGLLAGSWKIERIDAKSCTGYFSHKESRLCDW